MENWFNRLFTRPSRNKFPTDMTPIQGLACRDVLELMTDYLEGVLLPEHRSQFEEHLAGCLGCMNYLELEQVRLTIGMLRNLVQEPVFPKTKEELLQVFWQWKS